MDEVHNNSQAHNNDAVLVRNVIKNMSGKRGDVMWGRVTQVFAIGSGSAFELCKRFDLDPESRFNGKRWVSDAN